MQDQEHQEHQEHQEQQDTTTQQQNTTEQEQTSEETNVVDLGSHGLPYPLPSDLIMYEGTTSLNGDNIHTHQYQLDENGNGWLMYIEEPKNGEVTGESDTEQDFGYDTEPDTTEPKDNEQTTVGQEEDIR